MHNRNPGTAQTAAAVRFPLCSRRRTKLAKDDSAAVGEIGVGKAAAGAGMTKAASWSDFGTNLAENKPAVKAEGKREPAAKEEGKGKPEEEVAMVTERVPQSFINRARTDPAPRPRPITELPLHLRRPRILKMVEILNQHVDLEQNVLRQADTKGYAEVVVRYDDGVKNMYPLPLS